MSRQNTVAQVSEMAEKVAGAEGIEVVEVELKGTGRNQLLRVYIDKPSGVTHGDCEQMSRQLGEVIDAADILPEQYTLEVSSPGVERKLKKPADFERFQGQKVRVIVKQDEGAKNRLLEGTLAGTEETGVVLETSNGERHAIPFASIDRANLKFDW